MTIIDKCDHLAYFIADLQNVLEMNTVVLSNIVFLITFMYLQVDNVALESLKARCSHLQRLNLSWTGGGLITEDAFCKLADPDRFL